MKAGFACVFCCDVYAVSAVLLCDMCVVSCMCCVDVGCLFVNPMCCVFCVLCVVSCVGCVMDVMYDV